MWSGMVDGLTVYQFYESVYLVKKAYMDKLIEVLQILVDNFRDNYAKMPTKPGAAYLHHAFNLAWLAQSVQDDRLMLQALELLKVSPEEMLGHTVSYRGQCYLITEVASWDAVAKANGIPILTKEHLIGEGAN